jgi:NUMOD4 motif/HNH endonuclease
MAEWRPIKNFEGKYEVSSDGRVRNSKTGQELTQNRLTKCGYRKASLYKNGKGNEKRIHRLVAETFIPQIIGKNTVNHKDGNKLNNDVANLEWVDRKGQLEHAYKTGLREGKGGSKNINSKLTDNQVEEIRRSYIPQSKEFGSVALAKKFGVTHRVILLVVKNQAYKQRNV